MSAPKKSVFERAKRGLDWMEAPEDDPHWELVRMMQERWTIIADFPPQPDATILVSNGVGLAIARVDGQGGLEMTGVDWTPTHWLPLPALPKPLPKEPQSIFRHNRVVRRY
ncbi:MAG: hypothetical protein G8237_13095 [Magnetococcales bacterium]|nr:hypothetical protein [Magnetococcales bacterium]